MQIEQFGSFDMNSNTVNTFLIMYKNDEFTDVRTAWRPSASKRSAFASIHPSNGEKSVGYDKASAKMRIPAASDQRRRRRIGLPPAGAAPGEPSAAAERSAEHFPDGLARPWEERSGASSAGAAV